MDKKNEKKGRKVNGRKERKINGRKGRKKGKEGTQKIRENKERKKG